MIDEEDDHDIPICYHLRIIFSGSSRSSIINKYIHCTLQDSQSHRFTLAKSLLK